MAAPAREATAPVVAGRRRAVEAAVPVVIAGVVVGIVEVVLAISFGALIFSGPLAGDLSRGIALMLGGATILLIVSSALSRPGIVASVQDMPTAVLAAAVGSIGATVAADARFPSAVAALVITSGAVALTFLLLGVFRLGAVVRFVPYPVIGGFLAGTGWFLAQASVELMTARPLREMATYVEPRMLARWLPGAALAAALLYVSHRVRSALALPATILVGFALYYLALVVAGLSITDAQDNGLLLGPFPQDGSLWQGAGVTTLGGADWGAVFGQALQLATVPIVAAIALLLNVSGVEAATEQDADLNRELRAAGLGNALVAAAGGAPGYQTLSFSILVQRLGAARRGVPLAAAAVCLLALVFGASVLSAVPRALVAGVLLFLGVELLVEWVWRARTRLLRLDYAVVLLVLVAIATSGFLLAFGAGLAAAAALFLVRYGKTGVINRVSSGSVMRSTVDRRTEHLEILRTAGDAFLVMELRGFVFFGSANEVLERIRTRLLESDRPLRFALVDLRLVTGVDSSAASAFARVRRMLETRGAVLVLTRAAAGVREELVRAGFDGDEGSGWRFFADLDAGVEWCEDALLEAHGIIDDHHPIPIVEQLRALDLSWARRRLERLDVATGRAVVSEGDVTRDVFFVESGRLSARFARGDAVVRLRTLGPGSIFGELALYLGQPRSASVVADVPSVVYRLPAEAIGRAEARDPATTAHLHRALAEAMAQRLSDTVAMLATLAD